MERKFTAFISYRHLPLDSAVAQRLHRMIERYRIPKDLQKDGQKHLGLVFRDRDELPLSNDLTKDIYTALDNAAFLIVVCTPDTPKSLWVQQEIDHFIRVHGRSRILTVLAAGTPEESIPEQITTVYDTDGKTVLQRIEPLCAYLVDDNPKQVMRNLRSEFLRLAAAILGCPYDSLKQRQKRYRAQQAMMAFGAVFLVALAIIAILLQWNLEMTHKNEEISGLNRQIQAQLEQTQLNESMALTLLSENQIAAGNRTAAIKNALAALEGDRPYYAPAEAALANALYVYHPPQYHGDVTVEMPENDTPSVVAFSDCGTYAIIDDCLYSILYDLNVGKEIWRIESPSWYHERYITIDDQLNYFVVQDPDFCYILSFETGEIRYEFTDDYWRMDTLAVSPKSDTVVILPRNAGGIVVLFNADTREEVIRFTPDGNVYRGHFSDDGKSLLLFGWKGTDDILYLIDPSSGTMQEIPLPGSPEDCVAMPDGEFILLLETDSGENSQYQFWQLHTADSQLRTLSDPFSLPSEPIQLLTHDQWLFCTLTDQVRIYDKSSGIYAGKVSLDSYLIHNYADAASISPEGSLLIARHNGICTITGKQIYNGSFRWGSSSDSIPQLERIFYGNGRIAYTTAQDSNVSFLRFSGDTNAVPADVATVAAPKDQWNITANFDGKILTLKDNVSKETKLIPCPYEAEDSLYVHRTFGERFMPDYSTGVAEMYYGQNGIVIAGYYEGGYIDEAHYDFDVPEAYMIYAASHGSWNWFENEATLDPSAGVFFMNTKPGFAIVSETNTLQIYDFASNSVTLELHPELSYLSGVRFSQDDRYLLAFDTTRQQSILYDLTDLSVVTRIDATPYLYKADFHAYTDEEKVYIEHLSNDSVYGVIIDRESQVILAKIPNLDHFDPETKRAVCRTDGGSLVAYPIYSTQELIAIAKNTLSGTN